MTHDAGPARYEHVQHGHFHPALILVGLAMLTSAVFVEAFAPRAVLVVAAVVFFVLTACFATLAVRDAGDHLRVEFGPVHLFRRRVRYADIRSVERTRSDVLDGWGIHWIPGRGWIWNLWGRDCVRLDLDGRPLRIGSDDADGLAAFLQAQVAA